VKIYTKTACCTDVGHGFNERDDVMMRLFVTACQQQQPVSERADAEQKGPSHNRLRSIQLLIDFLQANKHHQPVAYNNPPGLQQTDRASAGAVDLG